MSSQVVGLGQCAIDYLGIVDKYPAVDTKKRLMQFVIQGGGPVATALVALSRWGVSTSFIGKISDDYFGKFITQSLLSEGVDISGLVVEPGKFSQFAFIAVEEGTGHRNIFWTRGDTTPLQEKEINWCLIQQAHILHLDGLLIEASLAAAYYARKKGIPIVLDAGSLNDGMLELAGLTDYLITSEKFAQQYLGEDNPYEAVQKMYDELRPRVACTTMGKKGSVSLTAEGLFCQPAYDIAVKDTTGAGDVFHGGFIYGVLQDWDIRQIIKFATAAAGLKCRVIGGRAGIPGLGEIHELIHKKIS
jgi:sulfofructose kinase